MRDPLVVERAQDVHQRVGVAVGRDIQQRVGAGSRRPAGNVGELDRRRHPLLRVVHLREDVEARVRHPRNPQRGFHAPVRAPRRVIRGRHELEQGRLPGRRITDQGSAQHEVYRRSPAISGVDMRNAHANTGFVTGRHGAAIKGRRRGRSLRGARGSATRESTQADTGVGPYGWWLPRPNPGTRRKANKKRIIRHLRTG